MNDILKNETPQIKPYKHSASEYQVIDGEIPRRSWYLDKKIVITLIVLTTVIIGGIFIKIKTNKQSVSSQIEKKGDVLPTSDIIPTIDESVNVNLTSQDKKEVILIIENLPKNTTTIEYELSYFTKGNLPKGVIGTIETQDKDSIERRITLGTCSSGTCVYDEGVNNIKVSLKFEGEYGNKLFEKEFDI